MKYPYLIFAFILCMISCSKGEKSMLADGNIEIIDIANPGDTTHVLTQDEYIIDSICALECPNEKEFFEVSKFMVKNGRTYIMDSRVTHTVYVFDHKGHFLFKAGEKGRAKNEYIQGPTEFFVDNQNNLHVFDYDGQKIIIFNDKGNVDKVISTREHIPHTFGLTNDNRYMYAYNQEAKYGAALTIDDEDNKAQDVLIPLKSEFGFTGYHQFDSNGNRLSHIPNLSDSILVYKNSSLEKIVRVDFHGKTIMNERPDLIYKPINVSDIENDEFMKYFQTGGVIYLEEYQETDSLQYLTYCYHAQKHKWLNEKNKNRVICGIQLFIHKSPLLYHYLVDNQIVTLTVPFFEKENDPNEKSCAKVFYIRLK